MADQPTAPGQGTAGSTDVVIALQGVVRQLTHLYKNGQSLITALGAVNFPQNLQNYTVATLPSSPSIGMLAVITNGASALAWGANATASTGTATYLVWWNGSIWTVVGK